MVLLLLSQVLPAQLLALVVLRLALVLVLHASPPKMLKTSGTLPMVVVALQLYLQALWATHAQTHPSVLSPVLLVLEAPLYLYLH